MALKTEDAGFRYLEKSRNLTSGLYLIVVLTSLSLTGTALAGASPIGVVLGLNRLGFSSLESGRRLGNITFSQARLGYWNLKDFYIGLLA